MTTALIGALAFLVGLAAGLAIWHRTRSRAQEELESVRTEIVRLQQKLQTETDKQQWSEQAEKKLRETFSSLAGEALNANTEALAARTRQDLKGVIEPLKENLTSLDTHVRELEKTRKGAYESLNSELKQLKDTHQRLQESTVNLTNALKAPTVRGRWGEVQLRRVVEMAGMTKHVDFSEQTTGEQGRPDMVINLPNGGALPIDAKVPLDAFLDAMESPDESSRCAQLERHAKAMRSRVNELGMKQYWEQFEKSPDFVVMFIPNEACLGAAFEFDAELLQYAIEKKVLICSPVNLLALLKTVAYGWQQQQITENANQIAQEGKELYSRLIKFNDHLVKVGKGLEGAVKAYNDASGSLDRRLVPAARRFRELGLATTDMEAPRVIDNLPTPPTALSAEDLEES